MDSINMLIAYCVDRQIPFERFEKMVKLFETDKAYYEEKGFALLEQAINN
jgi:hypothetical protein